MIFEIFGAYLSESFIFPHGIFFGSKILISSCDKQDDYGCPKLTLKTRLKSSNFGRFLRFWAFFKLFVLAQTFSLGHWLFMKNLFNIFTLTCGKRFLHYIKFWANNKHNAVHIFIKSALWSGPYKLPFSALQIRKTWNLVSF